jgi:hypothetical protein
VATVWPSHREPYYARGAAALGANIDWSEARWNTRHFLEPLLLPDEPVGEMGCLLLALALGAKEAGERTLARDVLVQTVHDGRLDVAALGGTLARLYNEKIVKATRTATSLGDAARTSSGHADAVASVLEHLLAGLNGPPQADLGAILEVLVDLLAQQQRSLEVPGARAYLADLSGSGKTVRLARRLSGDHAEQAP